MTIAIANPPQQLTITATVNTADKTTVLGKYQFGRLLGCGSFAKVYHARSLKDNKSVAIKIHEAMASKTGINLVMELARGDDLFGKLSRRPDHRCTEHLARRYFSPLVSAINYCHKNGIFHRDLKPQNILLDNEGNIKMTDYGILSVAESPLNKGDLLRTACGTPAFAAPEIAGRTRAGFDGRKADAWSCGVILFVLLTGYLPFDDSNLVIMYRKMHKREFWFPSWVSKAAKGLIVRLLDPNPYTRLTVEEIVKDDWLKDQGLVYPRKVSLGDIMSLEEKKREKEREMMESSTSMNAHPPPSPLHSPLHIFLLLLLIHPPSPPHPPDLV